MTIRTFPTKTIFKTVLYKLLSSAELALIAWVLTHSLSEAGKFGGVHLVVSAVTYGGFEHFFEHVWGWFKS